MVDEEELPAEAQVARLRAVFDKESKFLIVEADVLPQVDADQIRSRRARRRRAWREEHGGEEHGGAAKEAGERRAARASRKVMIMVKK